MKDVYWTTAGFDLGWSLVIAVKLEIQHPSCPELYFIGCPQELLKEMSNYKLWVTSALLRFCTYVCVFVWCGRGHVMFCKFSMNFVLVCVLALTFCLCASMIVLSDLVAGVTNCEVIRMCLSSWFMTQRGSLTLQLLYITLSPTHTTRHWEFLVSLFR